MLSAYSPGPGFVAGKLNSPFSLLTTLTVTMPFLALITTPSIAPSAAEVTVPVRAVCAWAGAAAAWQSMAANAVAAIRVIVLGRMAFLRWKARASGGGGGRRGRLRILCQVLSLMMWGPGVLPAHNGTRGGGGVAETRRGLWELGR